MINRALNYLSTAIFRSTVAIIFSVSKCHFSMMLKGFFNRNMHDLLHTSTSCHFKICLKSRTTGTTYGETILRRFGAQFISTPLQKMME